MKSNDLKILFNLAKSPERPMELQRHAERKEETMK